MTTDAPAQPRPRRIAVTALVILAVVSTFVSTVAVWAHNVALNTDAWVRTVGPLVDDPEVTDALAVYIVDQVFVVVDVEEFARDALPDQAGFLAGPLTDAARSFLTDQVQTLLETDQFHDFWIAANRTAHSAAVRVLRGQSGVVTIGDGEVGLNLLPMVAGVLRQIDELGWLPDRVTVPEVTRDTPPDEAVAAFEDAFGVDLADDFGQIGVYDSDTLAQAQEAVRLFDRAVLAAVLLTIVLAIAAIALGRPRRRVVLQLALGVVAGFMVAWAAIEVTTNQILGLLSDDVNRSAAAEVVDRILGNLRSITRVVSLIAIVAAMVAFVSGPSAWAVRTRTVMSSVAHRKPIPTSGGTGGAASVATWVAAHRDGLRVTGLVVALLAAVIVDLTPGSALTILVVLVGYEIVVALVPGTGLTTEPPA